MSTKTTRITALMAAVLMTAAINGAVLWGFDTVAQEGAVVALVNASSTQG